MHYLRERFAIILARREMRCSAVCGILFTGRRQFKHFAGHLLGADVLGNGLARPHPREHLAVVLGPGTSGRCQTAAPGPSLLGPCYRGPGPPLLVCYLAL